MHFLVGGYLRLPCKTLPGTKLPVRRPADAPGIHPNLSHCCSTHSTGTICRLQSWVFGLRCERRSWMKLAAGCMSLPIFTPFVWTRKNSVWLSKSSKECFSNTCRKPDSTAQIWANRILYACRGCRSHIATEVTTSQPLAFEKLRRTRSFHMYWDLGTGNFADWLSIVSNLIHVTANEHRYEACGGGNSSSPADECQTPGSRHFGCHDASHVTPRSYFSKVNYSY